MDYSQNFLKSMEGRKNPIFMRDPMELYDLSAFGIKLPHPPPNPTKIPKDVLWWARNRGGASANMSAGTQGADANELILRILRSGGRV